MNRFKTNLGLATLMSFVMTPAFAMSVPVNHLDFTALDDQTLTALITAPAAVAELYEDTTIALLDYDDTIVMMELESAPLVYDIDVIMFTSAHLDDQTLTALITAPATDEVIFLMTTDAIGLATTGAKFDLVNSVLVAQDSIAFLATSSDVLT